MSKIALTPNASGTGTFTIAAPNSNTNRTLTLPDAAGEIYNRGSILGTVSQSGGVPTGAIIESGSNANGDFVRYADGTMLQSILYNNGRTTSGLRTVALTFPAVFVDTTYAAATSSQSAVPDIQGDPSMHAKTVSGASFTDNRTNGTASNNCVMLLGRWF
jgi:hypothetical protein